MHQNRKTKMTSQVLLPKLTTSLPEFILGEESAGPSSSPIQLAVQDILREIGEDPSREGLQKTPERVARMWVEITAGYTTDPVKLVNGALFRRLQRDGSRAGYRVLHYRHHLPFCGAPISPIGWVIGLSKIPRIVEMYARRLQVQERMTIEIAHFLEEVLHPKGVAVVVEGSHMCAMMRGVKKSQANMATRCMLGAFQDDPRQREEFLAMVNR
jgi:GTP cyclohydrolase I